MTDASSTPHVPDLRVLVIEHEAGADPALVGERLELAQAQVTVAGPDRGVPVPATLEGFDALIVLGGAPGPTEDDKAPWLPAVRHLLSEALDTEVPTLGVCLGAQMLATVAGSTVAPIEAGPEVGLVELEITDAGRNDPLLGILADQGPVRALQWHWLEAKALPEGAEPLFTSAACSNQAFRIGPAAWGVQFHLEALTRSAEVWTDETAQELAELGIDPNATIIPEMSAAEPDLREMWSRVIDRWIQFAANRELV